MLKCSWNLLQWVQNAQKWLFILFLHPKWWKNEEFMTFPCFLIIRSTNCPISGMILQISPQNTLTGWKFLYAVGHILSADCSSQIAIGKDWQA